MKKLLNIEQLSEEIGIPTQSLRTWMRAKKISCIRLGHRSVFFDAEATRRELARFTVKAIGE